uniref:F-box domain-containing protein n=2 Tax=Leersia perrieri TaxID=77586 RepID=A0A0D9XHJ8_9ORYZ
MISFLHLSSSNACTHATCSTKGLYVRGSTTMAAAHAPSTDMLSDFPEGVLHRIMSFLTLRQAVQTCILSQRWCNLWRSMPHINADSNEFDDLWMFRRFVKRTLKLRDPVATMDSFCLWYSIDDPYIYDTAPEDANKWISHALQKQTSAVEVYFELLISDFIPLALDHSAFTSLYLTKVCFSNVMLDYGFFKQLEMGCPALEHLSLHDCNILDEISSQTLKVLTIIDTHTAWEDTISISTPSVTSLTLSSPMDGMAVLKNVESVVTASIKLIDHFVSDDDDVDLISDIRCLRQYLWTLSGVKNLEFYYLGRENSPRLEKLTLKICQQRSEGIIGELNERSFTCEQLKFVEVICSKNDPQVSIVEDFFLNNGMTAAQIHIRNVSIHSLRH